MSAGIAVLWRRVITSVPMSLPVALGLLVPAPPAASAEWQVSAMISTGGYHSCALENGKLIAGAGTLTGS